MSDGYKRAKDRNPFGDPTPENRADTWRRVHANAGVPSEGNLFQAPKKIAFEPGNTSRAPVVTDVSEVFDCPKTLVR